MDNPFLAPGRAVGNVVLDLDGVVFLGSEAIPGAGETLRHLDAMGWTIVFATNNGTRTRAHIEERISRQTGFVPDPRRIVTSALAACGLVGKDDVPVFVVGEAGLLATLADADVPVTEDPSEARCVMVALDRGFTYDRLSAASVAIRGGARFIATNSDVTFPVPGGQVPGAGSLVAAIAAAAGTEPEFAGKPHSPMMRAVEAVLEPGETWMIGDRPETDLAFAVAAGWRSVLTLSGVTADPAGIPEAWRPDLVVASLADLLIGQ